MLTDYGVGMPNDLATKILIIRRSLGKNQTEFGELLGVTQASVSRWEKGSIPDPHMISKLADLAQEDVRSFLGSGGDVAFVAPGKRLMVKGAVAAGVWVEAYEWPEEDWMPYTGGDHVQADEGRRFGLRCEGDSMNEIYPHGTILDCISTLDGMIPHSGQRVIVVRKRADDSLEATVKEYLVNGDGRQWLVPRSTNPAFQVPFSVDEPGEGIVEATIIGIVVGSYRPE